MAANEKAIERALNAAIKAEGGWSVKLLSDLVSGLPDRMVLLPGGRMFFVEVKSTGETPTKIQSYIHKKLRSLNFDVFVVDSMEGLEWLIMRNF